MKLYKKISTAAFVGILTVVTAPAISAEFDINSLLNLVKKGQARDNKEFNERIKRFNSDKAQQQNLLAEAKAERKRLETESVRKEKFYAENEVTLAEEQDRLTERLGSLKELFGVLQQVAGDSKAVFEGSLISSQLPKRDEFLTSLIKRAGSSSTLPSMEELEQLWFEMQREMTYSGHVASYTADVVMPSGETVQKAVVRVGSFNAVSNSNYLVYDLETAKLVELSSQPGRRYNGPAGDLESASTLTDFWIDPSRGQLLKIMGQSATLTEKIDQGGVVGYIILCLGLVGVFLAVFRMFKLAIESKKINAQIISDQAGDDNSLGRVMAVFNKHKDADIETLELHLAEAIGSEIPNLTKGINWIKIISVVTPLLGLLGTVTGMIDVFETMSLFGTGDPKLMAGGISQALVTTVLGLVAAIPCVFLHTMANNRSRMLIMILEERATGILARKSESLNKAA